MSISANIKNIRELKNYTQEYIAYQLGITQAGYSKIEKGSTSLSVEKLQQLSVILELPLENIINFESQKYLYQMRTSEKNHVLPAESSIQLIKSLYEDKIDLLEALLGKTNSELQCYKEKYGVL
jgi:transcriptional regulator with XRE-family HTH domain